MNDVDLAVRLLRATPTHERRDEAQLRRWAEIALAFGDELAEAAEDEDVPVVERDGGVTDGELLLAEYRKGTVTVYRDSVARMTKMATRRGWPVSADALRKAAVAHELAHHRIDVRELNRRLGHTAARLDRFRVRGHVAGADEIAAHRFAHRRSGIGVSPLLLSTALSQGD
ncbi:hypothetical protein FPZ12_041735 [Amycolatopsis acidicola]|uniref:Uncharacterized protein n=1 Tax=Amycolatopsis acidicola TaxID=2596893 RepID=A0A5N0UMK3_9PSEU|nr:hypothetical protein [Amycolatopsis acidicola]KAA9150174.1 hypothetical protein FPZ12_041735 [Amycolatopsis acidicola]